MAIRKYRKPDDKPDKPTREYGWNSTGANFELTKIVNDQVMAIPEQDWKPWTLVVLPCGIHVLALGSEVPL